MVDLLTPVPLDDHGRWFVVHGSVCPCRGQNIVGIVDVVNELTTGLSHSESVVDLLDEPVVVDGTHEE